MRWLFLLALLTCYSSQVNAAIKPCEELKEEIAAKMDAKGVQSYELTIVKSEETENGTVVEGKIVGSCEGGTKKILYTKVDQPTAPHTASNHSQPNGV
ncbi:MAG: DUF1161 domain-containing protein [Candidatus Electrothrix sp. AUS4]|nr:DUF1161 domain-containing protein [Candidatus Electrothrix sp. AUS4]